MKASGKESFTARKKGKTVQEKASPAAEGESTLEKKCGNLTAGLKGRRDSVFSLSTTSKDRHDDWLAAGFSPGRRGLLPLSED